MYSLELFLSLVLHTDIFYYLECEGHPRVVDGGELELEIVGILLGLLHRLLGRLLVGDDADAALRGHNLACGVGDDVRGDLVEGLRGVRDRSLRYYLPSRN